MSPNLKELSAQYKLEIEAPFSLRIGGQDHVFQCLIRGYGAEKGMVVDKDWEKIEPVSNELVRMGFGFSCFDIENSGTQDFQEVLDDWGKVA